MTNSESVTLFVGVAATAGAFLGIFITALLSRANVTSTLRQNWINSVRNIFYKYLSHAEKWTDIPERNSEEAYIARLELIEYVYQAKLYLNENEKKSKDLMILLENIPVKYKNIDSAAASYKVEKEVIINLMQKVLKDEWNRVRDGEILWSLNNFFIAVFLPRWFYISRIRLFWVIIFLFLMFIIYISM